MDKWQQAQDYVDKGWELPGVNESVRGVIRQAAFEGYLAGYRKAEEK